MAKELLIQKGLVMEIDPDKVRGFGQFSFTRWLKRMFVKFGVPYADCCEQDAPTGYPVRLSADKTKLEFFDSGDFTWKISPVQ